jgi:hypothetical protein
LQVKLPATGAAEASSPRAIWEKQARRTTMAEALSRATGVAKERITFVDDTASKRSSDGAPTLSIRRVDTARR